MARPRFRTKQAGDQGRATRSVPRYQPQRSSPYMSDPNIATGLYAPYLSPTMQPALMQRQQQLPRYGPAPVQPAPYTGPYDTRQSAAQIRATPQQAPYHGPYDTTVSGATAPQGWYNNRSSMSHQLAFFRQQRANWTPADYLDAQQRLAFSMQYPQANTPFALMLRGMEGPPNPVEYAGWQYPEYYGGGRAGGGGGGYTPQEPRRPGMGYYGSPPRSAPRVNDWYGQMISWNISGV
jgi:hypothetical protein